MTTATRDRDIKLAVISWTRDKTRLNQTMDRGGSDETCNLYNFVERELGIALERLGHNNTSVAWALLSV